jgi:hypothetical protein
MRFFGSVLLRVACVIAMATGVGAGAQQMPPAERPLPMPSGGADTPTLRITTKEVLVPTLVEKNGGGIVYGLKGDDFVVEDNGVPQKVHVQEEMDTAPVALVVAVEKGGMSVLEFDKVAKLGQRGGAGGIRFAAAPDSRLHQVGRGSEPGAEDHAARRWRRRDS